MLQIKPFLRSFLSLLLTVFFSICSAAQNLGDQVNKAEATPKTVPLAFDTSVFKNSYDESRAQFLRLVSDLETDKNLTIFKKTYPSPTDPTLITDVVWIKTKPGHRHLQVYNSGLHGIEGHVGSAVQSWILKNKISSTSSSDYLFIHAMNPYGFKNNRRVNDANIDLNRNFVVDPATFGSKNQAYAEITSFLNPAEKLRLHVLSRLQFVFSAINLVAHYSLDSLRRAILLGQYQFPQGISFGGHQAQYQTLMVQDIYKTIMEPYEKIVFIDLHTGYGEKNKLHLLVANSQNLKNIETLQKIFSKERIDSGDQKHFYNVSGDLLTYLLQLSGKPEQISGVAFEFGTSNSQTTLGSIESLRRMMIENQNFQHQSEDVDASSEAKKLFLELFYPQNDLFKKRVLEQTAAEILKIDKALSN